MVLKLGQFLIVDHESLDDKHKHYEESAIVAKAIVEKDREGQKQKKSFLTFVKEKWIRRA